MLSIVFSIKLRQMYLKLKHFLMIVKYILTFSDFTVVVFYSNRNYFIEYCFDEKLFSLENKNSVIKFS